MPGGDESAREADAAPEADADAVPAGGTSRVGLMTIAREWGRIGCIGFGGPPAHIALLRALCVDKRGWMSAEEFEDGVAATNMLPGPASTQLAIFCAWRLRGPAGALLGGACFIVPGLIVILSLSALFLATRPPSWIRGAADGAGAAVPVVAIAAAISLVPASWRRTGSSRRGQVRWVCYLLAGGAAAALTGPFLVLLLIGCGLIEMLLTARPARPARPAWLTARRRDASGPSGGGPGRRCCPRSRPALPPSAASARWRGWRSRSARCRSAAASSSSR